MQLHFVVVHLFFLTECYPQWALLMKLMLNIVKYSLEHTRAQFLSQGPLLGAFARCMGWGDYGMPDSPMISRKLLILGAVYVPGHLNQGVDILLRQGLRFREWGLHLQYMW